MKETLELNQQAYKLLTRFFVEVRTHCGAGPQTVIDVCEALGIESQYCVTCNKNYPHVYGSCYICGSKNY